MLLFIHSSNDPIETEPRSPNPYTNPHIEVLEASSSSSSPPMASTSHPTVTTDAAVALQTVREGEAEKEGEDDDSEEKVNDRAVRDVNDKTELQVVFYYLRYPSHSYATRVLDAKVEHYKNKGHPSAVPGCLDKALTLFRMKRKSKRRSMEASNTSAQVNESEGKKEREEVLEEKGGNGGDLSMTASSGEEHDAEYFPHPEDNTKDSRLLRKRRKMAQNLVKQRAKMERQRREHSTLSLSPSLDSDAQMQVLELHDSPHTMSSFIDSYSSSSSSSSSTSPSPPSTVTGPGPGAVTVPLPSHPPFSSHFVWSTGGHHMPATWWKVFTEVNRLFQAAKPDAQALSQLPPWFSVTDLEMEQLGMVLLPPAQRVQQLVMQEEVLCWDQASHALTKDGYFTKEFTIKLHHCLEQSRNYNGGFYGDDQDSDDEAKAPVLVPSAALPQQPVMTVTVADDEAVDTSEEQLHAIAATPQSRASLRPHEGAAASDTTVAHPLSTPLPAPGPTHLTVPRSVPGPRNPRQEGMASRLTSVPPSPPLPPSTSLSSSAPVTSSRACTGGSVFKRVRRVSPAYASDAPGWPGRSLPSTLHRHQGGTLASHTGKLPSRAPRVSAPAAAPVWSTLLDDSEPDEEDSQASQEVKEAPRQPERMGVQRGPRKTTREVVVEEEVKGAESQSRHDGNGIGNGNGIGGKRKEGGSTPLVQDPDTTTVTKRYCEGAEPSHTARETRNDYDVTTTRTKSNHRTTIRE